MKIDHEIFDILKKELGRQRNGLELIASENFVSKQVMAAMGSVHTNKYAEGYPGRRYYGSCQWMDASEGLAIERVKKLFGAEYANVQPHSGAQANAAVMLACLKPGDTFLGFELSHGGHLTHGSPVNFSGKLYNPEFYFVERETGLIDWDKVEVKAKEVKPKMIICGASAYSRDWDYERLRKIADKVGAILMADISHPAGIIAKGRLNDPLPHCHIITSTTHKTLRGPRGGMILMGKDFENPWGLKTKKGQVRMMSTLLDSAVFPGTQGGPLEHVIAAKAVAFHEALTPEYGQYIRQVVSNAKALAKAFMDRGYNVITGGTDSHLVLIDLRSKDITGRTAEDALGQAHITINKNMVPFDERSPFVTSGMRLGTAALTTRGMTESHMQEIVELIDTVLQQPEDERVLKQIAGDVVDLSQQFPLYPDMEEGTVWDLPA